MIIMKKTYIQPQTTAAGLIPTTIICTSGGYGGSSDTVDGEEIIIP